MGVTGANEKGSPAVSQGAVPVGNRLLDARNLYAWSIVKLTEYTEKDINTEFEKVSNVCLCVRATTGRGWIVSQPSGSGSLSV